MLRRWLRSHFDSFFLGPKPSRGGKNFARQRKGRPRPQVEALEDRNLLTVQAVSLADPGLLADTAGGLVGSTVSVSDDGRYVAFSSIAPNVVGGYTDNNSAADVFLHDRVTGTVTLVSHSASSATTAGNGNSGTPSLSGDGRYVAFVSLATDLVPGQIDMNGVADVFLFDRMTGAISLVSRATGSETTTGSLDSVTPSISVDGGQYVVFLSRATNLVAGQIDANANYDVFLFDRAAGTTTLVSRTPASAITTGNGFTTPSDPPRISGDGGRVAFGNTSTNLVAGQTDTVGGSDVFLFDRATGTTTLVSHTAASATTASNLQSEQARISRDGRFVTYSSFGTNLVTGQVDNPGFDVFLFDQTTGANLLVSRAAGSTTATGNGFSLRAGINGDGRYVTFSSLATNLVTGQVDTNNDEDVFLFDRVTGTTMLVTRSATSAATTANAGVDVPNDTVTAISNDGRYVAFQSSATNLVSGQTEPLSRASQDVFLFDRTTGMNTLVSHTPLSPTAASDDNDEFDPVAISADGNAIFFGSSATNLTPGLVHAANDLFAYDVASNSNTPILRRDPGLPSATGNGSSWIRLVSATLGSPFTDDGRQLLFGSFATNLVQPIAPSGNLFLRDLTTARTSALHEGSTGDSSPRFEGFAGSASYSMSGDGRFVAFTSEAARPVSGQADRNSLDVFLYDRVTGTTTLISHAAGSLTTTANDRSIDPVFSRDGRYVVFRSEATNLVSGQTDSANTLDVFLFDRVAGTTTLVSRASDSATTAVGTMFATPASISRDGRYVVFSSTATNVIAGQTDPNVAADVFLFDRQAGTNTLVSRSTTSPTTTANRRSDRAVISDDGQFIAFASLATDLVGGQIDNFITDDVFLVERATGTITLVSHLPSGPADASNGSSAEFPVISEDSRYVAYFTTATNLVTGQVDANANLDVFLYDRLGDTNTLVSRTPGSATTAGNARSRRPVLSSDGRYVAFSSLATDLVSGQIDVSNTTDAFLFDRVTGATVLASHTSTSATTASGRVTISAFAVDGGDLAISPDGRRVAFVSASGDLVANDRNGIDDVFVFVRDDPPASLRVQDIWPANNGFTVRFNQAIDTASLNLYDVAGLGPADVTVTGAVTGNVNGSLVITGPDTVTFVATTTLPADTYTVTLRSAANGFRTPGGAQLDGNGDGTAGDNYTVTFTIPSSPTVAVSIPNFMRGPGQPVDVPATGTQLPIRLSEGDGVRTVTLSLRYDPSLLQITAAASGPAGATVALTHFAPGLALLTFASPTALSAGPVDIILLTASVPDGALYTSKQVLDVRQVVINDGAIRSRDDDGIHVVGYFGDTTGSGGPYTSLDAQRALRVAVGLDAGFSAYQLADPVLIADITGNLLVNSTDALRILQEAVGIDQLLIPALPANPSAIVMGGPDPLLYFSKRLRGQPGQTLTAPLLLDPSDGLESVDLAISYDAQQLEVVEVRRGNLTSDFDIFLPNVDAEKGMIRVGLSRSQGAIQGRGVGSVIEVVFRIRVGAKPGRTIINLRQNVDATFTALNEGGLDLIPDPSNEAGDRLDGVITVQRPRASRFVLPNSTTSPRPGSDLIGVVDKVFSEMAKRRRMAV